MNNLKYRLLISFLFLFLSIIISSCAMSRPQVVMIRNSYIGRPVEIEIGTSFDKVINQLDDHKITYYDMRDNPFFIVKDGERKVVKAIVGSYDDCGSVNGEISYELIFDGSGLLIDSRKSIGLDKVHIFDGIKE